MYWHLMLLWFTSWSNFGLIVSVYYHTESEIWLNYECINLCPWIYLNMLDQYHFVAMTMNGKYVQEASFLLWVGRAFCHGLLQASAEQQCIWIVNKPDPSWCLWFEWWMNLIIFCLAGNPTLQSWMAATKTDVEVCILTFKPCCFNFGNCRIKNSSLLF